MNTAKPEDIIFGNELKDLRNRFDRVRKIFCIQLEDEKADLLFQKVVKRVFKRRCNVQIKFVDRQVLVSPP
ncbi:MAG TPA: hypothetical protein VFA52_00520 [Candidatus Paceibacterota bacterium]|nr:hypothetical protein [Candidatus Paceibacterota bacterium]